MTDIEQVKADAQTALDTLTTLHAKIDEIRDYIAALGSGATPAQIEELAAIVGGVKTKAESALAETDALDEPAPAPDGEQPVS